MAERMPMPIPTAHDYPRILIAGLGNLLMKDDGIGIHAVNELLKNPPRHTLVADVGTRLLHALHLFEEAEHAIVIDAMSAGMPPGTIYLMNGGYIANEKRRTSLHELGLYSAMRFIEEKKRPRIHILGVEPETIDYGMELTKTLQRALPQVCYRAREIVMDLIHRSRR